MSLVQLAKRSFQVNVIWLYICIYMVITVGCSILLNHIGVLGKLCIGKFTYRFSVRPRD